MFELQQQKIFNYKITGKKKKISLTSTIKKNISIQYIFCNKTFLCCFLQVEQVQ